MSPFQNLIRFFTYKIRYKTWKQVLNEFKQNYSQTGSLACLLDHGNGCSPRQKAVESIVEEVRDGAVEQETESRHAG